VLGVVAVAEVTVDVVEVGDHGEIKVALVDPLVRACVIRAQPRERRCERRQLGRELLLHRVRHVRRPREQHDVPDHWDPFAAASASTNRHQH
jgi:hypothetical protein